MFCFIEYRTCTLTNNAEQYCPLFKIFDCRPFTGKLIILIFCIKFFAVWFLFFVIDLECGLKTIPVRCLHNHCENRGICYVDLLRNLTQCVCPPGKKEEIICFYY